MGPEFRKKSLIWYLKTGDPGVIFPEVVTKNPKYRYENNVPYATFRV